MGRTRQVDRRGTGDRGATMAEYSLLLALVAILAIATFTLFALRTSDIFDKANDGFNKNAPTSGEDPGSSHGGGGGGDSGVQVSTTTTLPPCSQDLPPGTPCVTTTTP